MIIAYVGKQHSETIHFKIHLTPDKQPFGAEQNKVFIP